MHEVEWGTDWGAVDWNAVWCMAWYLHDGHLHDGHDLHGIATIDLDRYVVGVA